MIVRVSAPWLLFLTFLVLKLTQVIDWSWWWVTSPLWIAFILLLILAVLTPEERPRTRRRYR